MKALFLDRDGVINVYKERITSPTQIELVANSAEAIKLLNENNFKTIIITNQPQIAMGLCTIQDVETIHSFLLQLLSERNARIDGLYYCPHKPNQKIPEYSIKCECRKPKPGMILQAQKDFKISDLSSCFMIGDTLADIETGKNAGCKTILVKTGLGGEYSSDHIIPNYITNDLYEAVTRIILKNYD